MTRLRPPCYHQGTNRRRARTRVPPAGGKTLNHNPQPSTAGVRARAPSRGENTPIIIQV